MDDKNNDNEAQETLESLEVPETTVENGETGNNPEQSDASLDTGGLAAPPGQGPDGELPTKPHRSLLRNPNTYLASFIALVLIAIGLALWAFSRSGSSTSGQNNSNQASENLSPKALEQLSNSDVTIGGPKQVLTIQSDSVFNGQVLVKRGLQVAGDLQIGGNLSLPNIVVSGTSQFGGVQINKNLSVAGDTALQGQLTVQKSLTVKGGGNFSGPISTPQLTVGSLQMNGDLTLTHHINAGGSTPGRTNGGALGTGGSASVSGSDTAGSIKISTGSNPPAGCFVTINFATPFHATPHVVITPVGSAAASLNYYVNHTTRNFQVCSAGTPNAFQNFSFDYIVFD